MSDFGLSAAEFAQMFGNSQLVKSVAKTLNVKPSALTFVTYTDRQLFRSHRRMESVLNTLSGPLSCSSVDTSNVKLRFGPLTILANVLWDLNTVALKSEDLVKLEPVIRRNSH